MLDALGDVAEDADDAAVGGASVGDVQPAVGELELGAAGGFAAAFKDDFGPDSKFLYQRLDGKTPERMIRAYQVKLDGKPGPWLAGMTLDPAATAEAWCHQRGYVCLIEELHRKKVKAGETFGAAYVIGWFDGVPEMNKVYDGYRGKSSMIVKDGKFRLE